MLCEGGVRLCRGEAASRFRGYHECVWLSPLCTQYLIFDNGFHAAPTAALVQSATYQVA